MKIFRLKNKRKRDGYPADTCAASRCNEPSIVVDESKRFWNERVPLCDRHWQARCDCEEPDHAA